MMLLLTYLGNPMQQTFRVLVATASSLSTSRDIVAGVGYAMLLSACR